LSHQHLDDARAELAGDAGDLALVGVVGAFVEAALKNQWAKKPRAIRLTINRKISRRRLSWAGMGAAS
jgi:hypothetical protein